jgi:hypothetical protein
VAGITAVETPNQAEHFGWPQGTVLYTVEYADGTDNLVPEKELIAM